MPANPDHLRRDAEHAARMEISVALSKFQRRMYEDAKAHIAAELASAGGGELDGTKVGRASAARAIAAYGAGDPLPPVESRPVAALDDPAA